MDEVDELEWSKSTETLEDLLKNPKVKLPQLIKLASELECLDSKISLQEGQILNVLSKQTISYVNGTDSHGKDISLPLHCPYTVKLKVSPQNERTFNSVKDITNSDPLPKFVEVTKVGSSLNIQEQCVAVGDILKVVFVEKSGHLPSFVHFRNSMGTHIKLNVIEDATFQVAINYSSNILLSSLFEQYNREFPAFIQFCKQDHIPKCYLELGMVTLHSNSISTIDIIIASADLSSSQYVVVYPLSLGIKFEVNTKLKLANDKCYRELCTNFSNISVEDTNYYLDEMIGFKQNEHKLMIKYKKMKKHVHKTASVGSDKECNNGMQSTNLNSKFKIKKQDSVSAKQTVEIHSSQNSKYKPKDKDDLAANQKSVKKETKAKKDEKEEKKKNGESGKNEKEKKKKKSSLHEQNGCENSKSEKDGKKKKSSLPEENSENGKHEKEEKKKKSSFLEQNSDGKNENIYSVTQPFFSRVRSIGSHKAKKAKSNKSITDKKVDYEDNHDKPIIEDLYCEINYEALEKIQSYRSPLSSLSEVPPPLPGNHPCQKIGNINNKDGIYVDAVDSKTSLGGFYFDKASYSAVEISTWGIEEVGNCLAHILMDKHKTLFEDNLVDGKLLLDLDESVLVDLGLNIFEACKLRRFVLGWRPGSTRPAAIYPPLKGFSSDDPVDWDVEDTASHMLEIDVPEMAEFCHKNQVDGELLKDICVNEPIMNLICPGKKLKLVKIRNYVIDKWRPKKKCDENAPYETVTYDGISNKICSIDKSMDEKTTYEAPVIACMKQLEEKSRNSEVYQKPLIYS